MKKLKVLVSSAGGKISLIKAMQAAVCQIDINAQIVAGDSSANVLSAYVIDEFWIMPQTSDENLEDIIEGCIQRQITVVLPTRDGELLFWARHASCFHKVGIAIIVSSLESLKVCIDKQVFSDFGIERSLPFIPSIQSLDPSFHKKRVVVKEQFGAGSRAIGINLDNVMATEHARKLKHPIFQPYIDGYEISIDAWLDKCHSAKGLILRRRDLVVDGESQVTTTFRDCAIEEQAKNVIEMLKLQGPVVLQVMITSDGDMRVIECNARFGGASTIAIAAGLDSLYWSLSEIRGVDITHLPFNRIIGELRQVRISTDTYNQC